ncbi:MAG: Sir2 family NAD-dependent protein deacetylase [Thermomicrobiales bacterium]
MTTDSLTAFQTAQIDELAEIVRFHAPLVAFTGAGISTESGIPDYRGPNGLWTSGSQKPFTYDEFMSNPEARREWWRRLPARLDEVEARQPNAGHRALARIERAFVMLAIVTQNIDGLQQAAGSDPARVIELHGSSRQIRCSQCGIVYLAREILEAYSASQEPPPCPNCGGILKSGTISFGEPVPPDALRVAFAVAEQAGVMLVVGSTLLVNPAARVPAVAKKAGSYLAILNKGETGLDDSADLRVDAPAGLALDHLAARLLSATPGS